MVSGPKTDLKYTGVQSTSDNSRRAAIKKIVIGAGVATGAAVLPGKWTKPVVDKVLVPAHAQTSEPSPLPDFTPVITVSPDPAMMATPPNAPPIAMTWTITVTELNGAPSDGSPVIVRIRKDSRFSVTPLPAGVTEDIFYWLWTIPLIAASGSETLLLEGMWNAGATQGDATAPAVIIDSSGGDSNKSNNYNSTKYDYGFETS